MRPGHSKTPLFVVGRRQADLTGTDGQMTVRKVTQGKASFSEGLPVRFNRLRQAAPPASRSSLPSAGPREEPGFVCASGRRTASRRLRQNSRKAGAGTAVRPLLPRRSDISSKPRNYSTGRDGSRSHRHIRRHHNKRGSHTRSRHTLLLRQVPSRPRCPPRYQHPAIRRPAIRRHAIRRPIGPPRA
jgi:hypothetical protein